MKSSPFTQAMVVFRKELTDWSRDRRSIITVLVSSLLAPAIIGFMFTNLASRQRQIEDVKLPVVGAAKAPALIEWLRQQPGVEIVDGHAVVTMTLTTPHCPVAESMPGEVELRVMSVPGIATAEVNLVWDPPWNPASMSDEARLELGML